MDTNRLLDILILYFPTSGGIDGEENEWTHKWAVLMDTQVDDGWLAR